MTTFLSEEILEGLAAMPAPRRKGPRLTVRAGGRSWPVLRMTKRGFAMERGAPLLPGRVDLYEGERHLMQGLAVRGDEADGEVAYEFKWCAAPRATAPRDFAADLDDGFDESGPIALIGC